MEQYISHNENFEPSPETKFKWLRIRKTKLDCAIGTPHHFEMPGYLNFNNQFRRDRILFWCAIILEFWGLSNIVLAGKDSPIILIGVPIAFLLDVTSAICAHWYAGTNCEIKNKIFLAQAQNNKNAEGGYRDELRANRYMGIIFNSIIIMVCLLKVAAFYGLNNGFDLLTFGISVSYIIVALIHINITGYYVAEAYFRISLKKERKKLQREAASGKQHPDYAIQFGRSNYEFSSTKELTQCSDGVQKLVLKEKAGDKYKYSFHTWGVFQDGELKKMIDQQPNECQKIVAFHGLSHQIQIKGYAIHKNEEHDPHVNTVIHNDLAHIEIEKQIS